MSSYVLEQAFPLDNITILRGIAPRHNFKGYPKSKYVLSFALATSLFQVRG
jgi:hypothetical protein